MLCLQNVFQANGSNAVCESSGKVRNKMFELHTNFEVGQEFGSKEAEKFLHRKFLSHFLHAYCFYIFQNEIFCQGCFRQYFDNRAKSVGPPDTSVIRGSSGRRDTCPRCQGTVFEAEKIVARSHDYHKKCLNCKECKSKLDASNFYDAPDQDVYCYGCYSVRFGHRSRAKSVGPVDTAALKPMNSKTLVCPRCGGAVFEAEKVMSNKFAYHKNCTTCR